MAINFEAAFCAIANAPNMIASVVGEDNVVKYMSSNISLLGWSPDEIIGTKEYCTKVETSQKEVYLRRHKDGYDIVMDTIAVDVLSNGDVVLLERVTSSSSSLSVTPQKGSEVTSRASTRSCSLEDTTEEANSDDIEVREDTLFVPTASVSNVPEGIIHDFVVNGTLGIHWVHGDGTIAWANEADMAICGYSPNEYIGSSVTNYHLDTDVLTSILTRLAGRQIIKEQKARLKHKDGSTRHVVINTSANFDAQGNFINTRCFTRDVTETRELELQAQAAEIQAKAAQDALVMKSLFLARMSHDIRTPLNGVIGMTSMLQTTTLCPEQTEFVEIIESSSKFLLNLIQDILDHSKIEAGEIDLDIRSENLAKLINESASLLRVECAKKDVDMVVNLPPEPIKSRYHMVDLNRLKQIVLNFLSNSTKFTARGSVTVTLDIEPSSVSSPLNDQTEPALEDSNTQTPSIYDKVTISVRDTGIGIDDVSELFGNFKQATKGTNRDYGGTGLGLSIAKSLTELMGGKIHLESKFGEGTHIWCEFLFERVDEQALFASLTSNTDAISLNDKEGTQSNAVPSLEQIASWKESLNILIAEDNKINQKVLLNMLKKLGYKKTTLANNGQVALDFYMETTTGTLEGREKFDLILMDCLMPELDGMDATKMIRQHESQVESSEMIPIIALTANAQDSDRRECLSCGMNGFITKPVNMAKLDAEIVKLCSQKNL